MTHWFKSLFVAMLVFSSACGVGFRSYSKQLDEDHWLIRINTSSTTEQQAIELARELCQSPYVAFEEPTNFDTTRIVNAGTDRSWGEERTMYRQVSVSGREYIFKCLRNR